MSEYVPGQGDVFHVDFGEPIGHEQGYRRPALVISGNEFNTSGLEVLMVAPLTTEHKPHISTHVLVPHGEAGLPQDSYIKCEDIRSVSIKRLERFYGKLTEATMDECLNHVFNIFEL